MARDSSPFAQRLKALAKRPARSEADDASTDGEAAASAATGPVVPPEPGGATPPAPHHHDPAPDPPQEIAAMPDDEQPTGEFPAIDPTAPVTPPPASPVPDAPLDQRASTQGQGAWPPPPSDSGPSFSPPDLSGSGEASGPADDDQPTTQMPAVSPIWLDPPAYEQDPPAGSGAVDWSSPADDVFEPTAAEPPAHTPIWEQEFEPADTGAPFVPEPFAAEPDPEPASGHDLATPAPAPEPEATGPVRPAWMDEADEPAAEPSGGAVVPPPRDDIDADAGSSSPSADLGPTLSPPVLSTPTSTPDALNDALRLDDDEDLAAAFDERDSGTAGVPDPADPVGDASPILDAAAAEPVGSSDDGAAVGLDETAPTDAAPDEPTDTQSTQVQDAVPEPPRRGWRSAFGKRKAPVEEPTPATEDAPSESVVVDPTEVHQVQGDASDAPSLTKPDAASEATASDDAPAVEDAVVAASGSTTADAIASTGDAPDSTEDETPVTNESGEASNGGEAPADGDAAPDAPETDRGPGRFAALGRLAKVQVRKPKAAPSHEPDPAGTNDAPTDADADAEAKRRAQAQEAEGGQTASPEPVAVQAPEPPPLKPSFTERAALRRRAKSLRARRDAGLAELGAIVLDQSRFGDPTAGTLVRRRTTELADLDNEIAAIEAVLEEGGTAQAVAQLGVVHCSSCSALLGPADRFCVHCGTARPATTGDGDASPA